MHLQPMEITATEPYKLHEILTIPLTSLINSVTMTRVGLNLSCHLVGSTYRTPAVLSPKLGGADASAVPGTAPPARHTQTLAHTPPIT